MSVTQTDPPRAEAPEPEPPRRARPSAEVLLLAAGVVAALVVFVVWQTYPNYDTYYTLVWGQELFHGHLPDYDVFRTPTPHPLSTLVAWAMAPFGTASDRILVLVALLGYVGFLAVMFAFTKRLLGRTIAFVAVAVLLTRTDMQLLALRAMFDLPFYLMIFAAALLELRRPRAGWPVLVLLALAGLLRPEAWLLGGVYWLWLARDLPRARRAEAAAARRRRPGAVDAGRHDRHRRAAVLAHLDARGLRRVRPQPRDRRRAAQPAPLLGRQRHDRHGRRRRHGAGPRGLDPAPEGRAAARAGRPRPVHVPDHQRRRPLGDPALHDDPVAAADAVRRGRARGLDAGRARHDRPQGGGRGRRALRADHRLAGVVLRLGLLDAGPPGRASSSPSTSSSTR